jgi:hypothetical protein
MRMPGYLSLLRTGRAAAAATLLAAGLTVATGGVAHAACAESSTLYYGTNEYDLQAYTLTSGYDYPALSNVWYAVAYCNDTRIWGQTASGEGGYELVPAGQTFNFYQTFGATITVSRTFVSSS